MPSQLVKKTCQNCDEPYEVYPSRAVRSRYCSLKCTHGGHRAGCPVNCERCGQEFYRAPSYGFHRFCSSRCSTADRAGANSPAWKGGKVSYWCDQCGAEVKRRPGDVRWQHVLCSRDCQSAWQSENLVGPNSPIWQGGKPGSGVYFRAQRGEALRLADYQCERCGFSEIEYQKKYGKGLDVHHIRPYTDFTPGDPAVHDIENLRALCRACHIREERMVGVS